MKSFTKSLSLLFILGPVVAAFGGDATGFHEKVLSLYSFSPHTLDAKALEAKSKDLDVFWDGVKAGGPAGLDDLRRELGRADASPFFSYDGAKLLLSLSKARPDQALALTSMVRSDLRDLQRDDYFNTIHWFAVQEFDTTGAAFKILGDPKFQVFVPQHALTLDQEMCLVYLLLPTKEEFYLAKAIERLFVEKDVTAQKSLLTLIASSVTRAGDEALGRFAAAQDQPEDSRQYARKIIDTTKGMASSMLGVSLNSYASLKQDQRKLFARVSDEALGDWEFLRVKIRRKGYK